MEDNTFDLDGEPKVFVPFNDLVLTAEPGVISGSEVLEGEADLGPFIAFTCGPHLWTIGGAGMGDRATPTQVRDFAAELISELGCQVGERPVATLSPTDRPGPPITANNLVSDRTSEGGRCVILVWNLRSLDAWTIRVALNWCRSQLRYSDAEDRAVQRLERSMRRPSGAITAEGELRSGTLADDVQQAVLRLPLRQRKVVVLHCLLDMDVASIAALVERSQGAVKNALFHGRAALARELDNDRSNGSDPL